MTSSEQCPRCGSPTVGNEIYCSSCGDRLAPGGGSPVVRKGSRAVFWVLGTIVLVGLVLIGGVYVVGRRVSRAVHEKLGPEGNAALARVARSMGTASKEGHRDKDFGCRLISVADASAIAGTTVTRTESSSDGCTYFGIPDASLDPDADSVQELAAKNGGGDAKTAGMIRQMTGALRSSVEQQDPGTRAGPGGERPLFAVHASAALSLSMEVAKKGNGSPELDAEVIHDLGDDAFFVTMHRMFFVRRGTDYLLIQPLFVHDRRAVGIAAARKILDSPSLHS